MNPRNVIPAAAASAAPADATDLYSRPPAQLEPFRVLLLLPESIPSWLSDFLDQAAASRWLDVCVLPVIGAKCPDVEGLPLDMRSLLALERRRARSRALSSATIHERAGLTIAPEASADTAGRHLRARVRELRPDVVLSLGPPSWAEELSDVVRYGCWNLDAGLVDPVAAGTELLAPVLQKESATRVQIELKLHGTWNGPTSLAASWGSTQFGSFTRQREHSFLKLPMLLLRTMRRMAAGQLELPRYRSGLLRLTPPTPALRRGAGIRAFVSNAHRIALWQLQKRRPILPWMLVLRQDEEPLDPAEPHVHSAAVILAESGKYWADPCVIQADGRNLVFVEEMAPNGKGTVACLELASGEVTRLGLAVEEPGHLSFPQVFQHEGRWFMTLESSALKRVSLYEATDFPLRWTRVADLVTGRVCVDPILYFHQGRWYLFATVAENRNSTWDELFLFVSEHLTGPFEPHPANPILSDVRRARPAGRLFKHDGKLIRPAQDCASGYGSAVVFNEVLELDPERYSERALSRLAPDWSPALVACHTYSAAEGVELLDARGDPSRCAHKLRVREIEKPVGIPPLPVRAAPSPAVLPLPPKGAAR